MRLTRLGDPGLEASDSDDGLGSDSSDSESVPPTAVLGVWPVRSLWYVGSPQLELASYTPHISLRTLMLIFGL